MGLLGNGEGHTVLILTDAESRLIRNTLELMRERGAMSAWNRGIVRGTERIKAEFDAAQKAKRKP